MSIQEIHTAFKISMDRIDTLSNEDFNVAEIDWLLNEAALIFLKRRSESRTPGQRGFEATQKRVDDLSTLLIKYPLQPALAPVDNEVDLADLSYPYYRLVSAYCDALISPDCTKRIPLRFSQHDDYIESLRDPFNSPSLEFIPYNFGRSSTLLTTSIYLYPGDFNVTLVYLEYLKYPVKVNYGNYVYIDGVTYPPTTFDFPEHTHQEIVDIACQIASLNIESPEYIQLKTQKTFISE